MNKTKVSILCLTYNQEKYIKQALDSFLMQKTNFDFEVLIHDDASTDKTIKILKKYQKKYPKIIKVILEKENRFSKGIYGTINKVLLPKAKGQYISLCEGDDFFTDKNKLQIQADYLDSHSDCALCFHRTNVFFENKEKEDYIFPDPNIKKFSLEDLLKYNYIHTNSVMYRRQNYKNFPKTNFLPGDWYLHLYHAQFGKIGFIDQTMSSYRRHPQGVWFNAYKNVDKLYIEHGKEHLLMFLELITLYYKNEKYKTIIINNFKEVLNLYTNAIKKEHSKSLQTKILNLQKKSQEKKEKRIKELDNIIQLENNQIYELEQNLKKIRSSKAFKLWRVYCKLKRK
jgi:glycosyltransferase involved in cell wall biosynthesis